MDQSGQRVSHFFEENGRDEIKDRKWRSNEYRSYYKGKRITLSDIQPFPPKYSKGLFALWSSKVIRTLKFLKNWKFCLEMCWNWIEHPCASWKTYFRNRYSLKRSAPSSKVWFCYIGLNVSKCWLFHSNNRIREKLRLFGLKAYQTLMFF